MIKMSNHYTKWLIGFTHFFLIEYLKLGSDHFEMFLDLE